jgi:hypothetical protein
MNRDFGMVDINFDFISTKHHVGYILPDVANCIDIPVLTLLPLRTYSSSPPNVLWTHFSLRRKLLNWHTIISTSARYPNYELRISQLQQEERRMKFSSLVTKI